MLDTRGICSFADFFVLTSAESERQIEAIRDEIKQVLKKDGVLPHHEEGRIESGWIVMDYGSIIVHIFSLEQREYYQLEKIWDRAPTLLRVQ